jgi:hypothetical protein
MGLTIHYTIATPKTWTHSKILSKLQEVQKYATGLNFNSVSPVVEFKDKECDWQWIRENGDEKADEYFWAKIQATRYLSSSWKPGQSGGQSPNRMICFSLHPADGCEEMNIGICSYPRYTFNPDKKVDYMAWSIVHKGDGQKEQTKVLKGFMTKWNLRKMSNCFCSTTKVIYGGVWAEASITRGQYLSHRRGWDKSFGIVLFRDQMCGKIGFRYKGTVEEAELAFSSNEFQSDLDDMVYGKEESIPASFGEWNSFCKTQYAGKYFVFAHLGVCAVLDKMIELGFKVTVNDEGEFWEKRNVNALIKEVGEWDSMIAAVFGAIKDSGMNVESPITNRSDFEQLEMRGREKIENFLKVLRPAEKS